MIKATFNTESYKKDFTSEELFKEFLMKTLVKPATIERPTIVKSIKFKNGELVVKLRESSLSIAPAELGSLHEAIKKLEEKYSFNVKDVKLYNELMQFITGGDTINEFIDKKLGENKLTKGFLSDMREVIPPENVKYLEETSFLLNREREEELICSELISLTNISDINDKVLVGYVNEYRKFIGVVVGGLVDRLSKVKDSTKLYRLLKGVLKPEELMILQKGILDENNNNSLKDGRNNSNNTRM